MRLILLITIGLSVSIWADFARDNTMQIVTDTNTKLQWQDDVNVTKTWINAINYCEALELGGYKDQILPNQNELHSIIDISKRNNAINSAFKNVVLDFPFYWSSTTIYANEMEAWGASFDNGEDAWLGKSDTHNVRCVRDGQ